MIDLSDVTFIKRVIVGSNNPADLQSDDKVEAAMEVLNRCLSSHPKGKIIGIEKSFSVLQIGEHNVVLQWSTYHVGFLRKPTWLEE